MSQVAFPRRELGPILPPAEQVHMDVVDELATTTAHVHPKAIPLCHNLPLCCQMFRDHEELAHQRDVLFLQVIDRGDMQFGNDQHVYRCLWSDVFKSDDLVVFVHNARRCALRDDLTENTRHSPSSCETGQKYGAMSIRPRRTVPHLPLPLLLPFEQELHNLRHDSMGALVQLVLREIGNGMLHTQIFIVGEAPCLGHRPSSRVKHIGNNRRGWNTVLFKQNTVEHTARAARASIADPGDDDIAVGSVLVDDLFVGRHTRAVLAAYDVALGTVLLL